ncbi:DivIVA domain-containing protein [Streptomonospora wellingtoniae]|uniref:Cell wall synthesis protein Wag31 n=1 Tax=Streptomonospora wellingtoniae TaxID=3075544 RepID=A0ABU2KPF7_9ACTN|nr:DivIVA domain-containing protein [Streptomonospora sp. DSM 45055]MDT0301161.1 DivIVA domain-containing protein [Streptomonospora sp. DSM 45055]
MPLTPADVRNKQFSTTRLRPGYDEEEVDAFLDEVETELDRLIQENEELRGKLAECLRGKVPNAGMQDFQQQQPQEQQLAPEPQQPEPAARQEPPQPPQPQQPQPQPQQPLEQQIPAMAANMGLPGSEENMDTAARVLALAQQTADQAISDARREADETLGRARHEADDILGKARRQAEQIVNEARARSENLDRDAQERHRQVMGSLVQQREELEHKVAELKDFEREYRSRLKDYFERQLRELAEGANEPNSGQQQNPNTTGGFQTMAPTGGNPGMPPGGGPANGAPSGNPFAQPEPAQHGGYHPGEAPHERR